MEQLKPKATKQHYSLETSLSPLWKLTYYSGLSFDWCRRIPKQSKLSIAIRWVIRFSSIVLQFYFILTSVFKLCRAIANPESKMMNLVLDLLPLWDRVIILFVCVYLLIYRADIQGFFSDWSRMEEQYNVFKGVDSTKLKRTSITIYTLYYIYGISFLCYSIYLNVSGEKPVTKDDDLVASFYPGLISNQFFVIWVKFQRVFFTLMFNVYGPLMDIVPAMVFYYAAKIVEGIKWEVKEINVKNLEKAVPNTSEIIYDLWSRFEVLSILLERADKIFGAIVIMCHAYLFSNLCGNVYFLFRDLSASNTELNPPILICYLLFPAFRFVLTLSLMCKLDRSSFELLSAVAYFTNRRANCSDKEERRMVSLFFNRLKQIQLAPCPSGYYHVKQSIFLTALNLIVTYTIILLQTNNEGPSKSIGMSVQDDSTSACICHS